MLGCFVVVVFFVFFLFFFGGGGIDSMLPYYVALPVIRAVARGGFRGFS